jgi:hypothetical protein
MRSIAAARSNADSAAHAGCAAEAASIAARASARVPAGSSPMAAPLEGLVALNVAPLSDGRHSPATYMPVAAARISDGTAVSSVLAPNERFGGGAGG